MKGHRRDEQHRPGGALLLSIFSLTYKCDRILQILIMF